MFDFKQQREIDAANAQDQHVGPSRRPLAEATFTIRAMGLARHACVRISDARREAGLDTKCLSSEIHTPPHTHNVMPFTPFAHACHLRTLEQTNERLEQRVATNGDGHASKCAQHAPPEYSECVRQGVLASLRFVASTAFAMPGRLNWCATSCVG
eukprot:4036097-Alexandrium_andersonii.AAC.1